MLLSLARLLALLALVSSTGCGPSTVAPLDVDPAMVRAPASDLSDEAVRSAVATVLGDERLAGLLASHPHQVEQVEHTGPEATTLGRVAVTVAFDQPLDDVEYPLDVCAIDTDGQPITGVRWLLEGDDIMAVSPRWGAGRFCGS